MINILRQIVVKTQPYMVFNYFYKLYYSIVLRFFLKLSVSPGVFSVYSCNSYANGTYIPGISDIDLVYIYKDNQGDKELFNQICSFKRWFHKYNKFFPMIDSPQIFEYEDFQRLWDLLAIQESYYAWHCEYGEAFIESLPKRNFSDIELAIKALRVMRSGFYNNFHNTLKQSRKHFGAIERSSKKIYRYLNSAEKDIKKVNISSFAQAKVFTLSHLQKAIIPLLPSLKPHSFSILNYSPKEANYLSQKLAKVPTQVESIVQGEHGSIYVIIHEPITEESIQKIQSYIWQIYSPKAFNTYFYTNAIWEFLLRCVDPMLYYELQQSRTIVFGKDPCKEIAPPIQLGIQAYFCYQVTYITQIYLSGWFKNIDLKAAIELMISAIVPTISFIENNEILIESKNTSLHNHLRKTLVTDPKIWENRDIFNRMQQIKKLLDTKQPKRIILK